MAESQPDSIVIVDTMGCATPEAIKYTLRWVRRMTGLPIEIHTHNDFGMGVATQIAAVTAGVGCVHLCANGLGEASDEQNAEILDLVKQAGIKKWDILTADEFTAIAVPILSRKVA